MIRYVDFSLFDSPAQTLVNTVNTVGVMGKGIAAVFKRLYPAMFKEYRRLCLSGELTVGKLYIYRTENKIVVNFPTKKDWHQPSRVEFIEAGLKKFSKFYQDYGISSVSFPQLGCGHGELSWEKQVQPVMERYLRNIPIPVYIHIYEKSPDFVPERLDAIFAREVRLERERISLDQLWTDLHNITGSSSHFQLSLFGPYIEVNSESIKFQPLSNAASFVYREDLEDLWNILRIRGTIQDEDVPESIRSSGVLPDLFDLLGKVEYIKTVDLRSRKSQDYKTGLKYDPKPEKVSLLQDIDIVV